MIRPTVHGLRPDLRMGRLRAASLQDYGYLFSRVRNQLVVPKDTPQFRRMWEIKHNLPLDQGQTPRCVGFSQTTLLLTGPIFQEILIPTPAAAFDFANALYLEALDNDEWEGNDPCCGTSTRAGMDVLHKRGIIGSYVWGKTAAEAELFIRAWGPVNFGTVWPDSMMETDGNGFLLCKATDELTGPHAEGHAYTLTGVDLHMKTPIGTGAFRVSQTWGGNWGIRGEAWMPLEVADLLLQTGGDCIMPFERHIKVIPT